MASPASEGMDNAANEAAEALEEIREAHPDGVRAIEEWVKRWVQSAGYKRLGKILADRWN